MKALVTGVTGQDGWFLSQYLLNLDYEVYGMVRGQNSEKLDSLKDSLPDLKIINGDLTDLPSLIDVLEKVKPDEIYNLAAVSFVGLSFEQPSTTADVTGLGTLRLLEAIMRSKGNESTKFYQASSSEMFGKVRETPQKESTPFYPRSPYGVAKTFAHYSTVNYREAYSLFACCGILFNHESERRGLEFVTRKITSSVAAIKLGLKNELKLGSLEPRRDWGYAGDYVKGMHAMLQHSAPDDYVLATNETHSVREFLDLTFKIAKIENGIERFVKTDETLMRPSEVDLLIGDYSKAKKVLSWQPQVSFPDLVEKMYSHDFDLLKRGGRLR